VKSFWLARVSGLWYLHPGPKYWKFVSKGYEMYLFAQFCCIMSISTTWTHIVAYANEGTTGSFEAGIIVAYRPWTLKASGDFHRSALSTIFSFAH
jgi:hypothetical protein